MVESNVKAALCYFNFILPIGLVLSLYYGFVEKKDKFVTFHAYQSLLLIVAAVIVYVVLGILMAFLLFLGPLALISLPLYGLVSLIFLLVVLYCMYKAYESEKYMLPVIGEVASKNA